MSKKPKTKQRTLPFGPPSGWQKVGGRGKSGVQRGNMNTFPRGAGMDAAGFPVHNLVMRGATPAAAAKVQKHIRRQEERAKKNAILAEVRKRLAEIECELLEKRRRLLEELPAEVRGAYTASMEVSFPEVFTASGVLPESDSEAMETGFLLAVHRYQKWLAGNDEVEQLLKRKHKVRSGGDIGRSIQMARAASRAEEAQRMLDQGHDLRDIALRFGVDRSTVYRWLNKPAKSNGKARKR